MAEVELSVAGQDYTLRLDGNQLRRRGIGDLITCVITDVKATETGEGNGE